MKLEAGPNFIELLSTKITSLIKQDYQPNFNVTFKISKQQLNTSKKKHNATNGSWLVIMFLSRKKFHAKQICLLSSMKLEAGHRSLFYLL